MLIWWSDLSRAGRLHYFFFLLNVFVWLEQVFVESLLCSSRAENIRLAGQHMHCSKVQHGGAPSRSFSCIFLCDGCLELFIFETLAGQRGRPRQSVLPGQRLRPQGRLRQQRGPCAGRSQRVLQLVGHSEGSLHGSGQVRHSEAPPLWICSLSVWFCMITPHLEGYRGVFFLFFLTWYHL